MSVDVLQDKIRKLKNPSMIDLSLMPSQLPPQLLNAESGGISALRRFYSELLPALKGIVPAVRLGFGSFVCLGTEGLQLLTDTLALARKEGYYVLLDAPQLLSPQSAQWIADAVFAEGSVYPCDGLVIPAYPGSDIWKPFLPYCKEQKKDIFAVVRTANRSGSEIQDLLCGGRLVHAAAADLVNRYGADAIGKSGYSRVSILTAASSAESLRTLRAKYNRLFLLVDGLDYSHANAKNCSYAFDKVGHGAAVCAGTSVTCAWQQAEGDPANYISHAQAAAERMKKNLTRYVTVL